MIKKYANGIKKGKVKMDKTYKCDRCKCQDICKLEDAFRNTQDKLNEIVGNSDGDGYFSIEIVCSKFIPEKLSALTNRTIEAVNLCFGNEARNACADNMTMNKYITEENKNGRNSRS